MVMQKDHRSTYAKFRCGTAPIKLKTGRYEGLAVEDRIALFVKKVWKMNMYYLNVVCMTIFVFNSSMIKQQFLIMCMFIVNKKFLKMHLWK